MDPSLRKPYDFLKPGFRYRVTQSFHDFDRFLHTAGEMWTYLGYNFVPYEDGLSLFVLRPDGVEWQIRMQLRNEEQGPVIAHLAQYLRDDD